MHFLTKAAFRPDNYYDNAAVETFFKTIKSELIWRHSWETRRKAEMAIFHSHGLQTNHCRATEYINGFYNPRRRHSALGWKNSLTLSHIRHVSNSKNDVRSLTWR